MRAIIPAAGIGSRLLPMSRTCPKGLVEVGGGPLLSYTLASLSKLGISLVVCVTGHCRELLEEILTAQTDRPELAFVYNPDFAHSNSVVSLALSREWWDEEFCIVDSDLFVHPGLLARLVETPGDILVVDNSRAPEEIDMKTELREGFVWHLDKELSPDRTHGEFFGVSRWTPAGGGRLSEAIDSLLLAGRRDAWYEYAIRDLAKSYPIRPLFTQSDQWFEIDTLMDLEAARARLVPERTPERH